MTAMVDVTGGRLEVLDLPGEQPAVVLLHEGLGSIGLWRGLPERLATATGRRVVAYSRHGHGRSSAPPAPRTPEFMHHEARVVLVELLRTLDVRRPVLLGHSDGASIALIHAAEHPVAGVIAIAPHVFVEGMGIDAITRTRADYETGALRERMARYHDDPDAAFWGWAGVWLNPDFRDWDLRALLPNLTAPLLLVQGADDAYGTLAQLDAIELSLAESAPVHRLVVPGGHAPHLEHPHTVLTAVVRFIGQSPLHAA